MLTVNRGTVGLLAIAETRHTLQLSPSFATGMPVGAKVTATGPAIIGAVLVRTKLLLRVDGALAPPREREDRGR
jgi:hypothetical protein